MKLSLNINLSIKILMILLTLHQISCTDLTGLTMFKNLTGSTSLGVFSLGKYPTGGSITVRCLAKTNIDMKIFHRVLDANGVFTSIDSTSGFVIPDSTITISLTAST